MSTFKLEFSSDDEEEHSEERNSLEPRDDEPAEAGESLNTRDTGENDKITSSTATLLKRLEKKQTHSDEEDVEYREEEESHLMSCSVRTGTSIEESRHARMMLSKSISAHRNRANHSPPATQATSPARPSSLGQEHSSPNLTQKEDVTAETGSADLSDGKKLNI